MNSTITFAVGGDHAGFDYKADLIEYLASKNIQSKDFGTYSADSVDYPDFAHPVAESVEKGEFTFGLLLCGSANGVAITANKHQGIRAGLAWNTEVAKLVRQHNDANVLCLPVRFIRLEDAKACIDMFLATPFEGGRHQNRVDKISCC
ncbi:MAG: Ribose-5-phosphate isomerase [Bacteroidota bacterium]|jgi:ribose 5-phosphate isomerase B